MASNTPKPTRGSADDHREDKEGSDADVETAEVPDGHEVVEEPPEGEEGEETEQSSGGTLGGIVPSVNYRTIAIGAAAAIGLYLAWRYYQTTPAQRAMRQAEGQQAPQQEAQEGNAEPEGPVIPNDPDDPLAADEAAGQYIFDGWEGDD